MRGYDPFGNFKNMMGQFRQFMKNYKQYMTKQGIPEQYQNDPNMAIQYLMNSGKLSQADYNNLSDLSGKIQNQPGFNKYMQ